MAGGLDHLDRHLHLKRSLDRFLLETLVSPAQTTLLLLTTLQFSLEMTCCTSFEENPAYKPVLSPQEHAAVKHFEEQHYRSDFGRFVVTLPKRSDAKLLGESRSQAVHRFTNYEHSLHSKGMFPEFKNVIDEYFDMEPVPEADLGKTSSKVFYLPMHAVIKESSTTTKIRAVFDASAKTSMGVSLNDTVLVGPTVHSSLVDVLLHF